MSRYSLFRSKKGFGYKLLNWAFFRLFFVAVITFTIYSLVVSQVNTTSNFSAIRTSLLMERALSLGDGAVFKSSYTGRVYPGKVVALRFNDTIMKEIFSTKYQKFGGKMEIITEGTDKTLVSYADREAFENFYPLIKNKKKFRSDEKIVPVLLLENGEEKISKMEIYTVEKEGVAVLS